MTTIEEILSVFPTAETEEISKLNDIAVIVGYEDIETPLEFITKYLDSTEPITPASYTTDGIMQCSSGRSRSFTDLFAIVRAHFPELSIEEFAYLFVKYQENGDKQFYVSYCSDVKKIVFKCHKRHGELIMAHWMLDNGIYVINLDHLYVEDMDVKIQYQFDNDRKAAVDGVYEKIIIQLANSWLLKLKENV